MSGIDLIERIEVSEPSDRTLLYDVLFKGDRPDGFVSLNFFEFKHYITYSQFRLIGRDPNLEEMSQRKDYSSFANLGVKPDDIIVYLNQFHPNGQGLSMEQVRNYSRQGIGSYVFERIFEDSIARGAKVMTTVAINRQMRGFAKKNCFTQIREDKYCLVL